MTHCNPTEDFLSGSEFFSLNKSVNDPCQHHLNAIRRIIYSIQDAGCHALFMLKVPISNSLALKSADFGYLFPGVSIAFLV